MNGLNNYIIWYAVYSATPRQPQARPWASCKRLKAFNKINQWCLQSLLSSSQVGSHNLNFLLGECGGQLNVSTVPVFVFLMKYIYLHPPSSFRSGKNSERTEIHVNRCLRWFSRPLKTVWAFFHISFKIRKDLLGDNWLQQRSFFMTKQMLESESTCFSSQCSISPGGTVLFGKLRPLPNSHTHPLILTN